MKYHAEFSAVIFVIVGLSSPFKLSDVLMYMTGAGGFVWNVCKVKLFDMY